MVKLDVDSSQTVATLFKSISDYERAIEAYSVDKVGPVYLVDKYSAMREFQFPRAKMVKILKEMVEELDESLNSYGITREKPQSK